VGEPGYLYPGPEEKRQKGDLPQLSCASRPDTSIRATRDYPETGHLLFRKKSTTVNSWCSH